MRQFTAEGRVMDRLSFHGEHVRSAAARRQAGEEAMLRRAQHLGREDRLIVELSMRAGRSVREIGAMLGKNHGSVVRRLRGLRRRLADPLIVATIDGPCALSPQDREIVLAHLLRRESLARLAERLGVPQREVRRRLQYASGWFSGRRQGARLAQHLMEQRDQTAARE